MLQSELKILKWKILEQPLEAWKKKKGLKFNPLVLVQGAC